MTKGSRAYERAHRLIRKAKGRAADQLCCSCGAPAEQWAYHGERGEHEKMPYSLNPDDYRAMCRQCHLKKDRIGKYERTPELIEKVRSIRKTNAAARTTPRNWLPG